MTSPVPRSLLLLTMLLIGMGSKQVMAQSTGETTKVEPHLTYRYVFLNPRPDAVYAEKAHKDANDQIYVTLKFSKTAKYVHDVVIEPSYRTVRSNPNNDEWLLEQAYIDSALSEKIQLTAGKKTEYEGPGFMVNPSDLLNIDKDLFDPLYQKEGVTFVRLALRHEDHSIGLGYIPDRGADRQDGLAWLTGATLLADTDLRMQATYHPRLERLIYGFSASRFFGGVFELHFDGQYRTYQIDPDMVGRNGTRDRDYEFRCSIEDEAGEDCFSSYGRMEGSGYYLGGTRLVLSPRRTLVAEYIVQQSGMLPEQFEGYYATIRKDKEADKIPPLPPTTLRGRHYGFLSYQDDDTVQGLHLGASALLNTDDRSYFVIGSLKHHLSEITSLEFSPNLYLGGRDSEFGEMPFTAAYHLVFRGRF